METNDLTVVETAGDLLARTGQLGEAVRVNHGRTMLLFEDRRSILESGLGKTVLEQTRKILFEKCPDVIPYLRRFSEGLGKDVDRLIGDNVLVMLSKTRLAECSGFIIQRKGRVVVGQNWDTGQSAAAMAVLEIGRDSQGANTVRFTSALIPDFWSGVNPFGLMKGSCSGPFGDGVGDGMGLTGTFWGGIHFYRCRTAAQVAALGREIPLVGKGVNCVYRDPAGNMAWTRQGGGRIAISQPETDYCVATGYRPGLDEPSNPKQQAEKNRWLRLMELGREMTGKTGNLVEDVKAAMSDHVVAEGHSDSAPCRHDGTENSTQFSVITDVTGREVHYSGQPCHNRWKSIRF